MSGSQELHAVDELHVRDAVESDRGNSTPVFFCDFEGEALLF